MTRTRFGISPIRGAAGRFGHSPRRRARGVTLVELLIAIGGMAVISGIALEIYDTTQKASVEVIARQESLKAAAQLIDVVAAKLRGLQPPDNFDVSEPDGLEFGHDSITALFFLPETKTGLRICTVEGDGRGGYEWVARDPLAMPGTEPTREPLGASGGDAKPRLSFRYAKSVRPGALVQYVDSLPGDQWPAVIEITAQVPPTIKGGDATVLRTAITPGIIAGRGGEAAQ